jgi:hypothetical protein
MEQHKMSILNSPLTRTKAHRDAVAHEAYKRTSAEKQSAQESEYAHRAKPRNFDDDEMLAMCGIPTRPRKQ